MNRGTTALVRKPSAAIALTIILMSVVLGCGGDDHSTRTSVGGHPEDKVSARGREGGTPDDPNKETQDITKEPDAAESVATCHKGSAVSCAIEAAIVREVNAERAKAGLAPLAHSGRFSFVARQWSAEQSERGSIGHEGFPKARVETYQSEFGEMKNAGIYAENVAGGGGAIGRTPQDAAHLYVVMWMASEGHRANILGRYETIGVGVTEKGDVATQIFGSEE